MTGAIGRFQTAATWPKKKNVIPKKRSVVSSKLSAAVTFEWLYLFDKQMKRRRGSLVLRPFYVFFPPAGRRPDSTEHTVALSRSQS